ncbi:NERD domain-containing protein [Peribacillus tepidiphilus]|uniref:NERD domain-containing protein n=1 Tax=Peribacillus tepidiphilus TaxID=2652445 RepID=UPI001291A907|nr:NERD domain-containing protein [Peribacillus tepidiphilus]
MGQLIKLQDYISRYELDIYHYPTQYVRLKKQQWNKWKNAYYDGTLESHFQYDKNELPDWHENEEKTTLFNRFKKFFKRNDKETMDHEYVQDFPQHDEEGIDLDVRIPLLPSNIEELKKSFLNQLFRFQLKWASSTLREKSFVDQKYYWDEKLRFFLQRFPDTFLILYHPVFLLKNAPVEVEVIVLSPTDAWCISFLEAEEDAAFIGSNEKFWIRRHHKHSEKKFLSPLISLNRMEKIVSKLFSLYEVSLPVKKVILCRNGYIDYPTQPFDVQILDKRSFPGWFERMRKLSFPLKHQQLKGAEVLLDYCQTTSVKRLDWGDEDAVETID